MTSMSYTGGGGGSFDASAVIEEMEEALGGDVYGSLVAEYLLLRADTDSVLFYLGSLQQNIDNFLRSLMISYNSYKESTGYTYIDKYFEALGDDEEIYHYAPDSLNLSEYMQTYLGYSSTRLDSFCETSIFLNLLNDFSTSVRYGFPSSDWGNRENEIDNESSLSTASPLDTSGLAGSSYENLINTLVSTLTQGASGLYDGISRAWSFEYQDSLGIYAHSSIGVTEPSLSDIEAAIEDDGGANEQNIAGYLSFVTRDFQNHIAMTTDTISSYLSNYLEFDDSSTIDDVLSAVIAPTSGQLSGRTPLLFGQESGDSTPESLYSKIISMTGYSDISTSSTDVNYLPFDRYSLITANADYLPAMQTFINPMLSGEQSELEDPVLNTARLNSFAGTLQAGALGALGVGADLNGLSKSSIGAASLLEACTDNLYSSWETTYDSSHYIRLFIFLLANENAEVNDALFNFLLMRSIYRRSPDGTGEGIYQSYLTGQGGGAKVGVIVSTHPVDQGLTTEDLISRAYEGAADALRTVVDDYLRSHCSPSLESLGGEFSVGTANLSDNAIMSTSSEQLSKKDASDIYSSGGDLIMSAILGDTSSGKTDLFDLLWLSVNDFQEAVISEYYGSSGPLGLVSPAKDYDILTFHAGSLNRYAREAAAYFFIRTYIHKSYYLELEMDSSGAGCFKYNTWDRALFKITLGPPGARLYKDPSYGTDISDKIDDWRDTMGLESYEQMTDEDAISNTLRDLTGFLRTIYGNLIYSDAVSINITHYLYGIVRDIYTSASSLTSMLSDMEDSASESMSFLREDDAGRSMLLTLSRNSVMTSRYLHRAFAPHYLHTVFPAGKTFSAGDFVNLNRVFMKNYDSSVYTDGTSNIEIYGGTSLPDFMVSDENHRKKIITVGLPAGTLDYLSYKAYSSTREVGYISSPYLLVNVYRRNLQDDSEISVPKQFLFDTSLYYIDGLMGAQDMSNLYAAGQTVDDLAEIMRKSFTCYNPATCESESNTFITATDDDDMPDGALDAQWGASREAVRLNHMYDYFLKTWAKLTIGIDLMEDSFPFNQTDTIYSTCDADKEDLFQSFLDSTIPTIQRMDTASQEAEFNKIRNAASQSLIFSSVKYRNKTLYSKMFDRVFCVYVDVNDFSTVDSNTGEIIEPGDIDPEQARYYQLFVTLESFPQYIASELTVPESPAWTT